MLRYDAALAYLTKMKYQNNIYRSNLSDRKMMIFVAPNKLALCVICIEKYYRKVCRNICIYFFEYICTYHSSYSDKYYSDI